METSDEVSNAVSNAGIVITKPRTRGIYVTDYGNVCKVSGPNAKTAFDIDMGERIPIEAVTYEKLRSKD